jgi:uncharacterized membrane protein YccC
MKKLLHHGNRLVRQAGLALRSLAHIIEQRRPAWMTAFSIDQASLSEGLRAATASTLMLLLGRYLHDPTYSWAAIGAFWTCLADAAGSSRMRLASMLGFALLSTVCGSLTAWAADAGTAVAALAILFFSLTGAFATVWGAATYQVTILTATACVVMVDRPLSGSWHTNVHFIATYLLGCLFATTLSFTVWRIHPFGSTREAIVSTCLRLADLAQDCAELSKNPATQPEAWARHAGHFRPHVRAAIELAHETLHKVPASRTEGRQLYQRFAATLDSAEQAFGCLIAVSAACERDGQSGAGLKRAARCLEAIAHLFRRIGSAIESNQWETVDALETRLQAWATSLEQAFSPALTLRFIAPQTRAKDQRVVAAHWHDALYSAALDGWRILKQNLSQASIGSRHAARVGIATTAAFLIMHLGHIPFGYWATMATLLVMQPSAVSTWPRSVERAVGSVLGACLAAVIGLVVHTPLGISLVVFPLVCATMGLRRVNYSFFVLFLTPTFVLVADFAKPSSEWIYAVTRFGNNVLGCVIALAATYLLWPRREPADLEAAIRTAVQAHLDYLARSITAGSDDPSDIEQLRRTAGLASNHAEALHTQRQLEQLSFRQRDTTAADILALLRQLAGTAAHLHATAHRSSQSNDLADWIKAVGETLRADVTRTLPVMDTGHRASGGDRPEDHSDTVRQIERLHGLLMQRSAIAPNESPSLSSVRR